MEGKELKKRLKKIPDADKNGDPIYKIDASKKQSNEKKIDKDKNYK
jgi:predicted small lipoprotein YifL